MSFRKCLRIVKNAFRMYGIYFRRNLYLTITISVSLLMFLGFAMYMDIELANQEQSYRRIQSNYIEVNCFNQATTEEFNQLFHSNRRLALQHHFGSCELINEDGEKLDAGCNLLASQQFISGISIRNGMDYLGGAEASNAFCYDTFELLCGRGQYRAANEAIISEDFSSLIASKPEDALGKHIVIGLSGPSQVYVVVGVYHTTQTETRLNKESFQQLNAGINPEKSMLFTVFLPENALIEIEHPTDLYLFFQNQVEYREIMKKLQKYDAAHQVEEKMYAYRTPSENEDSFEFDQANNTRTKALIMILVAVLAGISVFGTMENSISARKTEIGIKKALGAGDGAIMFEFLVENIITSIVAMLFSICLVSLALLAYTYYQRRFLAMDFVVWVYPSTIWLFLCYAFSSILGFSLIPAFRATQVNIIDTIRES